MKTILSTLLVSFFLTSCPIVMSQNKSTLEIVQILSADSLEGRYPGTKGFRKAAKYIESNLAMLNIKPFFDGSYHDTISGYKWPVYNIVGVIDNFKSSNDYILIGAHLDHLGKFEAYEDSIFNGANDNASGCAAVLQIARELKKHKFEKKVIIAFFTSEEKGLEGSKHLAKKLLKENINLSYMINFEMIGCPLKFAPNKAFITGFCESNFAEIANKVLEEEFLINNLDDPSDELFHKSDNSSFYLEFAIPSHTISTFDNYPYLHSPADEYSQLDSQNMDFVVQKSIKLILRLLEENTEFKLNNSEFLVSSKEVNKTFNPKNLDEAVKNLDLIFADSTKQKISRMEEEEFLRIVHQSTRMWIIKNWIWKRGDLSKYFNSLGINYFDDMSGIILCSYYRHIKNLDYQIANQIKFYQDFWRKEQDKYQRKRDSIEKVRN